MKKAGNLLLLLKMHFSFFSCIPQKWQTKLDHSFLQEKLLNQHARPIFLTAWFSIKWEIKKGCATLYLNFTLNIFTTGVSVCVGKYDVLPNSCFNKLNRSTNIYNFEKVFATSLQSKLSSQIMYLIKYCDAGDFRFLVKIIYNLLWHIGFTSV